MAKRHLFAAGALAAAAIAGGIVVGQTPNGSPPAQAPTTAATAPLTAPATAPSTGIQFIPPKSPAESLRAMRVRDGYAVELVAAEPLVADPVAFNWGTDGRLWVVEMADYPTGRDGTMKPAGRLRFLRDKDGNGTFDESVLFADELSFPTGVLPWRKGVIVTAAPDILYLEDTNGDGKADVRRVLYTGFAEGNPQLRVNSPTYGLDGWVHLANGLGSKGTVTSIKTGQAVNVSGRDVRIKPDTGEIEVETGPSQFGRRQDDFGDWFASNNSHPVRHVVLPEPYAKRNPQATLPPGLADMGLAANPKVYPISQGQKRYGRPFAERSWNFTSASSVTPVRDPLLFGPGRFEGPRHVFACEPVHNLVQHVVLTPAGSTFTAERANDEDEFLASDDPWFRPVYADVGPDGGLWVADMYRFMIEHPDWLPADGRAEHKAFFREGQDKGRIYRVRRIGDDARRLPPLDKMTTPQLVAELNTPNGNRRDLVRAMLVWKNDPTAVRLLDGVALSGPDALGRLHALAALDALAALRPAVLERALSDDEPAVRRMALRLAEPRAMTVPTLMTAALDRFHDDDPKVRFQLALSLGEWDGREPGEMLGRIALARTDDPYLHAAVLTSAPRHLAELTSALLAPNVSPPPALLTELLAMTLAAGDREASAKLIDPILTPPNGWSAADRFDALGRLLDALARQRTSVAQLQAVRADDALSLQLAGARDAFAAARAAAVDGERSPEERMAAVALMGRDPPAVDADFQLLASLLAANDPPRQPAAVPEGQEDAAAVLTANNLALKSAVVRAMARGDRVTTGDVLLAGYAGRTPRLRPVILDAVVTREPWALKLLGQVRAGIVPAAEVDATRRQRLRRHASAKVRELAVQVFGDVDEAGREKVVASYGAVTSVVGDALRGRRAFAENCAACHRVGDLGVEVGPNLQSVVGWPVEALVTAILDPSRSAEPRYLGYTATLDTGEAVYGLVVREAPAGVTMKTLDGAERTIARPQIKTLEPTQRSLMPDGFEAQINVQAMADVIAFLHAVQ